MLLQGNMAAACSLWFHLAPDLHCNEHSGQSIIHCSFIKKKRKKERKKERKQTDQLMGKTGKGLWSVPSTGTHNAAVMLSSLCCVCQSWETEKYGEEIYICVSEGGHTLTEWHLNVDIYVCILCEAEKSHLLWVDCYLESPAEIFFFFFFFCTG